MSVTVYKILKEAIVGAEIPPSTCLFEDQLTKALGASRTPLRKAFKGLQSDGLIAITPRKAPYRGNRA